MNIKRFLSDSKSRIRDDGTEGIIESLYQFYHGLWVNSTVVYDPGEPIWEHEWDLLIVLDACRPDLLREVSVDYPFVDADRTVFSNASSSGEWLVKNFNSRYESVLSNVAYLSGNPHTATDLPAPDALAVLDEVWKYGWDEERGTIPPRPITDRAIRVGRENNLDRLVVHYMQPHFPSIPQPEFGSEIEFHEDGTRKDWHSVWYELRHNRLDSEAVWSAYRANLRYVLDEVAILLNNIDAEKAVITADHGNGVGEYGIYGHPAGTPIDPLREVPWSVTEATDTGAHDPSVWRADHTSSHAVEERLADLGYRS